LDREKRLPALKGIIDNIRDHERHQARLIESQVTPKRG
jgi:hypothetical protein